MDKTWSLESDPSTNPGELPVLFLANYLSFIHICVLVSVWESSPHLWSYREALINATCEGRAAMVPSPCAHRPPRVPHISAPASWSTPCKGDVDKGILRRKYNSHQAVP